MAAVLPLLLLGGGVAASLAFGAFRELAGRGRDGDDGEPRRRGITASEFRERELALQEERVGFERAFSEAEFFAREEERRRAETREAVRLAERERDRVLQLQQRKEEEAREFERAQAILDRQEAFEREQRAREIEFKREVAERDAALANQAAQVKAFEVFSRTLPEGVSPVLRGDGSFGTVRTGETLSEVEQRRGSVAVAKPSIPLAAQRITTVPGVFVGANFRFKTIEEAQGFLLSSALKGRAGLSRRREGGLRINGGG